MPQYNNRNSSGQFSNGGYGNNNNNANYNQNRNNGGNAQKKKHSGAKFKSSDKNGNPCTTGWNFSKRFGLVTFLCVVTSSSVKSESGTGKKYISVMIKVRKPMSADFVTGGIMNVATGQVTSDNLGIVINPKAPNGGYCGKFGK
jgi:hypothetical protein